jgi:TetR/AcrR family transcriptional regulator, transcriptional repressor for nem operon
MARPRAFDPALTLKKAMMVFWERGYFNTSIDDIVAATGVSRYGLYDIYENKRGLFLAALDHYHETIFEAMLATIDRPGASVQEIRQYFDILFSYAGKPTGGIGCLMCNSASEVAPFDPDVAERVKHFRDRATKAFRRALAHARDKGEVSRGIDPVKYADFLTGALQTVWILARASAGRKTIANHIEVALAALK